MGGILRRITSGDAVLVRAAPWSCEDSGIADPDLEKLLASAKPELRELGVTYLARSEDLAGLSSWMDLYHARDTYYYDVVTWMDRLLRSPE